MCVSFMHMAQSNKEEKRMYMSKKISWTKKFHKLLLYRQVYVPKYGSIFNWHVYFKMWGSLFDSLCNKTTFLCKGRIVFATWLNHNVFQYKYTICGRVNCVQPHNTKSIAGARLVKLKDYQGGVHPWSLSTWYVTRYCIIL